MKKNKNLNRNLMGDIIGTRGVNVIIFFVVFLFLSSVYYRDYVEYMGFGTLAQVIICIYLCTGIVLHFIRGFYPMSVILFLSLIFYYLSTTNEQGWEIFWDALVTLQIHAIVDFLFLDRNEFNRPLYLALSKRNVTGLWSDTFSSISQVKHWMIICETIEDGFYVFHARGSVFRNLKPTFEIFSRLDISRKCYGFHNGKILKSFFRKRYQFCLTCQQYCDTTACFLCYPQGYACFLTKIIGRVEFYLMIFSLTFVALVNFFFLQWNIPFGLFVISFFAKDFWMEEYSKVWELNWTGFRQIVTVVITLSSLWYFQVLSYIGMLRIYVFLLLNGVLWLQVWLAVPPFMPDEDASVRKSKLLKDL